MTAIATPPVVHALPGRLRVHAPAWARAEPRGLEQRLRSLRGVERVRASAATGNVLVCFDANVLERERVLDLLAEPAPPTAPSGGGEEPAARERSSGPSAVLRPRAGPNGRARIPVSGL